MNSFRAVLKLARALLHILVGFFTILLVFPRIGPEQRQMRTQVWSIGMLRLIGIELVVKGNPALNGPLLLVANHMSWLDITALHAARFCRFVSKADIKKWPFIGLLASGIGTLFIERESRRDAMRVVHHMTASLQAGDVLGVFPEGTTTDGTGLLPFHANLFQAAITANAPIQPVALQFIDTTTGQRSTAPCYVGDDTLAESVWRTLTAVNIAVVINFGEPQFPAGRDRRTLALALQQAVADLQR
ncbi:MAG: 1-acyl-sn-glycerol-3-phosphate acyltransferase [Polaromonas sp.]|nr:1-acyl-sn-glycerol-3-phosphate acyltransferase [Polaromonas sp.]